MKRARLPAAFVCASLALLGTLGSVRGAQAAGPDPAVETTRLLGKVAAPETRTLVQDSVAKAKSALQRAQNARGAGDLQHATELDALALTWAQVADDLVRAVASEKQLADSQQAVSDLEQKSVRTQALIEQTIARRGRAEQNLKNQPSPPTPNKSAKAEPKPAPKPEAPAPAKTKAKASKPGAKK